MAADINFGYGNGPKVIRVPTSPDYYLCMPKCTW